MDQHLLERQDESRHRIDMEQKRINTNARFDNGLNNTMVVQLLSKKFEPGINRVDKESASTSDTEVANKAYIYAYKRGYDATNTNIDDNLQDSLVNNNASDEHGAGERNGEKILIGYSTVVSRKLSRKSSTIKTVTLVMMIPIHTTRMIMIMVMVTVPIVVIIIMIIMNQNHMNNQF